MGRGGEFADEMERAWRGDAEGEGFHGTAIRRLLDGVDAATASRRPLPSSHSIVELVVHLAAWKEWINGRVSGPKPPLPASDGWVRIDALTVEEWDRALGRLDASHAQLVATTRGFDDAAFSGKHDSLRFALHHDLYHGGQIGLLRKG